MQKSKEEGSGGDMLAAGDFLDRQPIPEEGRLAWDGERVVGVPMLGLFIQQLIEGEAIYRRLGIGKDYEATPDAEAKDSIRIRGNGTG